MLNLKNLSIKKRLIIMCAACLIPMIIIIVYLIYELQGLCMSYDRIAQNITLANSYNIEFEEEMNSVTYQMAARSLTKNNVQEKLEMIGPDMLIENARESFKELGQTSYSRKSREQLVSLDKVLDTLQLNVDNLNASIEEGGHYDEDMESLDSNIYVITDLVQDDITKYIYFESTNMEQIRQILNKRKNMIIMSSFIILLIIIAFNLFQSYYISSSITKPVGKLVKATEEVGNGNFNVNINAEEYGNSDKNEIAVLGRSFNKMTHEISDLVENIRHEQENSRILEMKLLQNQISPHFLYNTLDNIVWLSEDGRKEDVAGIVTSLSQFMRTTLSGGNDFVSIGTEIAHVDAYLQIQSFRYSDILVYEIQVSEMLYKYKVIKMTLQPIVENALYHGIKNKRSGGKIVIKAAEVEDSIKLVVEDNGMGMLAENLERVRGLIDGTVAPSEDNSGFGIANVAKRLKLNYGEKTRINVNSEYGIGTKVEIFIPKQLN
ncbi:MAG: histidine kinase [Lachnospiraceae bacterium]|nr:histidine kinase [Lachnospiraceae bacterium]